MLNAARPLCFSCDHEGIAMRRAIAKPRWIGFRTLPIWGLNASSAARSALWIDFVRKSTTQPFSRILVPRHGSSQCSSQRGFRQEGQENYKRTSSEGFATLDSSAIFVGRGTNPKSSQRQNCDPRRHWRGECTTKCQSEFCSIFGDDCAAINSLVPYHTRPNFRVSAHSAVQRCCGALGELDPSGPCVRVSLGVTSWPAENSPLKQRSFSQGWQLGEESAHGKDSEVWPEAWTAPAARNVPRPSFCRGRRRMAADALACVQHHRWPDNR